MDETITPQDGMNPEPEVVEETIVEAQDVEVGEETVPKSQFNQVLARAKKAELQLKAVPAQTIINKQPSLSEEDIEVKILKSQGMADDLIKELKAVAKARGKGLLDSVNDSIFMAIKREKETEEKAVKARLPASKGTGSQKISKGINAVGLSDAEHKELWKEMRDK